MAKDFIFPSFPHFLHGADYNPEQWSSSVWDEDMRLFRLAGMNEMTVGIFSWAKLEPEEGKYDFSWMDDILGRIEKAGGRVILSTPSGARPRWLAQKYPDVLRTDEAGRKNWFSNRQNHCLTSSSYRRKVFEIDTALAKRYGHHPSVIGWHISNELSGDDCFCPSCRQAFRAWCEKTYGTVERLNEQWWTTFWSHTYDSFEQIDPPTSVLGETFTNLYVAWRRFVTDEVCAFFQNEKDAIRQYSDLPVTTNIMWRHTAINYEKLTALCDFVSWDCYPRWHSDSMGAASDNPHMAGMYSIMHDRCRSYLGRPFLMMESTPSLVSAHPYNKLKRPGMHRLASLEAVAHGSDSVQYFQFRKSLGGHESLHGAVVDHSPWPEKTRVFGEVAALGKTLEKIEDVLGSRVVSRVALAYDMENGWALEKKPGFQRADKKYVETCDRLYFEFWRRGINVDVIDPHRDFSPYDLVVAPMLYMTDARVVGNMETYVRSGGTLISGYMLGMVNENDLCYNDGFPGGVLKDVFGVWNEETDTLYPNDRNAVTYGGIDYAVCDYCERIHPTKEATVLGRYTADFYAGEPAVVRHPYGKGLAYYVAARDAGGLFGALLDNILSELGIRGALPELPYGVTAHTRDGGENEYLFVGNYTGEEKTVKIDEKYIDLETGENIPETLVLPPFGAVVAKRPKDRRKDE